MKNFNFVLIIITIVVLAAIGIAFIAGTVYSSVQPQNWTETALYQAYLDKMNIAVIPFVLILIVTLGLCIPKRLFDGTRLLAISIFLVFLTIALSIIGGASFGLGFLLIAAAVIQIAVTILTFMGDKRLHFMKSGFFLQTGSALLHLGLIIFLFDFIILSDSPNHLTIFWIATAFIGIGMILSFYSQELSKLLKREQNSKPTIRDYNHS